MKRGLWKSGEITTFIIHDCSNMRQIHAASRFVLTELSFFVTFVCFPEQGILQSLPGAAAKPKARGANWGMKKEA